MARDRRLRGLPRVGQGRDRRPRSSRTDEDGWAEQVFFALDVSPIKDEYTLAYEWDGVRRGHLDPGRGQDAARARRRLRAADRGNGCTEVTYRLALDVSIPLIGMLKRKGEKILIDTALKGLKKRVESLVTGPCGSSCSPARAASASPPSPPAPPRSRPPAGQRTLVLSTDAAHSLADAFGCAPGSIGAEPTEVADRLFVQQVDAQLRFEQSWADIQRYLLSVLDVAGVDPVAAEELTVIPGAEEVLALLELRLQALSGGWDVIVVDCAPTAETLRLLALPEALGLVHAPGAARSSAGWSRRCGRCCSRAAGVPMPGDTRLRRGRAAARRARGGPRRCSAGPDASVRLVLTPENVVLAEARRSYTTLSLFGYRVDGVVANRVFPAEGADDWRAGWVLAQDEVLERVDGVVRRAADLALGVPPRASRSGSTALTGLAREVYGDDDPLATTDGHGPVPDQQRRARGRAAAVAAAGLTRRGRPGAQWRRSGRDRGIVSSADHAPIRVWRATASPEPGWSRGSCRCGSSRTPWTRLEGDMSQDDDSSRTTRSASVGEEAAKLLGALADWAKDHVGDPPTASTTTSRPAPPSAPTARSAGPCTPCAQTSPEVRAQLATAATALLQAASGLLATAVPDGRDRGGVEHIDLDDDRRLARRRPTYRLIPRRETDEPGLWDRRRRHQDRRRRGRRGRHHRRGAARRVARHRRGGDRGGHRRPGHRAARAARRSRRSAWARPATSTRPAPSCCSRPTSPGATRTSRASSRSASSCRS